jgi:hypothetical protein
VQYADEFPPSAGTQYRRALAERPGWSAFADAYRPLVNESHKALLKPSPVPWMRSLFSPIDWSVS